jgi:hypothetical protein
MSVYFVSDVVKHIANGTWAYLHVHLIFSFVLQSYIIRIVQTWFGMSLCEFVSFGILLLFFHANNLCMKFDAIVVNLVHVYVFMSLFLGIYLPRCKTSSNVVELVVLYRCCLYTSVVIFYDLVITLCVVYFDICVDVYISFVFYVHINRNINSMILNVQDRNLFDITFIDNFICVQKVAMVLVATVSPLLIVFLSRNQCSSTWTESYYSVEILISITLLQSYVSNAVSAFALRISNALFPYEYKPNRHSQHSTCEVTNFISDFTCSHVD